MRLIDRVRAATLEGLMSPAELDRLAELAAAVPADQAIVEIGSYRGLSSAYLAAGAEDGNGARVTCVDLWPQPSPKERDEAHAERQRGALEAFLAAQRVLDWPVTALRSDAVTVAGQWLQPVGLLFHDAGHDYESVRRDLLAWVPHHLASGGVVAVHDYLGDSLEETEVARAIADTLPSVAHFALVDKLWVGKL